MATAIVMNTAPVTVAVLGSMMPMVIGLATSMSVNTVTTHNALYVNIAAKHIIIQKSAGMKIVSSSYVQTAIMIDKER